MIDGQWRFARHAVDEWITLQTLRGKSEIDLENKGGYGSGASDEEETNVA